MLAVPTANCKVEPVIGFVDDPGGTKLDWIELPEHAVSAKIAAPAPS